MSAHELKVYQYHLGFLKDFPEIANWLNAEGYTILHSHQDFRMRVIYSFWDNHTAEAEKRGLNDATNSLMIAYCQTCKTIEIYHRAIISDAKGEKAMNGFNKSEPENDAEDFYGDSAPEAPFDDEIDRILSELSRSYKL